MSDRKDILKRIKRVKPELVPHPGEFRTSYPSGSLMATFASNVLSAGGKVFEAQNPADLVEKVRLIHGSQSIIINHSPYLRKDDGLLQLKKREEYQYPEESVLIIETKMGVAENGAVWFKAEHLPSRSCVFNATHLVIVLHKKDILSNMHHAYRRLRKFDYGVFISGPSKTADIEQSLVIGAQGAMSHTVFYVD